MSRKELGKWAKILREKHATKKDIRRIINRNK